MNTNFRRSNFLGHSVQKLEDEKWKSETLVLSSFEVFTLLWAAQWHRVGWRNFCHMLKAVTLFGCTGLAWCCSGITEQLSVPSPGGLYQRGAGRSHCEPLCADLLYPFPVASVIRVLRVRVYLDAQPDFKSQAEARTEEDSHCKLHLWEMGCWRLSMSKGTRRNFKGWRAWTCRLFSSVSMLHERTVVRASESTSEMLTPQVRVYTGLSWPWLRYMEKISSFVQHVLPFDQVM